MARGHGRDRVLVSGAVDPRLVDTLRAYGRGAGYEPEIFAVTDGRGGVPDVGPDVAAVIVQHPNVYGILEPVRDLFGRAHDGGARAIQMFDPLSLGVLAPPGELGADIAVAEGQALGNHLNYGGPYLGLIAARLDDVRRMPGTDLRRDARRRRQGRLRAHAPGARTTHPPREGQLQHLHEPDADGRRRHDLPRLARARPAWPSSAGSARRRPPTRRNDSPRSTASTCSTRTRRSSRSSPSRRPRQATDVRDALIERGFLAGVPLDDAEGRALAVAVTEKRSRDEIDRFAAGARGGARVIGAPIRRQDPPSGEGTIKDRSRPGRSRVRVRAAGRAGGGDPGGRAAPDRARAARGVRDRPGAPLHAALADELRRGHGLLPAGLVHHEVQPEGRGDRRRAARVPADAPVAARPDGPGCARDALAARGGALRDHRDGARHAAAAGRRVRRDDRPAHHAGVPRGARAAAGRRSSSRTPRTGRTPPACTSPGSRRSRCPRTRGVSST